MLQTVARWAVRGLERQPITQDHAAGPKRVGQHGVGCTARAVMPIRLGEDDVERDGGGAEIAQPSDQAGDQVATPGPLADGRQTALVHVHDDDPAAWRTRRRGAYQRVVDDEFEVRECRWPVDRKQRGEQGRNQPAKHHPAAGSTLHLTVTSTRRLRGSNTSLAVFTSSDDSPKDMTSIEERLRPAPMRSVRTAFARFRPSSKFRAVLPIVSVCPMTATSEKARCLTVCSTSRMSIRLSVVSSSESKRKNSVNCFGGGGRAARASP